MPAFAACRATLANVGLRWRVRFTTGSPLSLMMGYDPTASRRSVKSRSSRKGGNAFTPTDTEQLFMVEGHRSKYLIVEECLAHQVGNDVERAFRRASALEKRRAIMTARAEYCQGR